MFHYSVKDLHFLVEMYNWDVVENWTLGTSSSNNLDHNKKKKVYLVHV